MCKKSAVWWMDGSGNLKVWAKDQAKVSVLGVANSLLEHEMDGTVVRKDEMVKIIDGIEDHYLFKQHQSLIIRYKIGATGDTVFATDAEYEELKYQLQIKDKD